MSESSTPDVRVDTTGRPLYPWETAPAVETPTSAAPSVDVVEPVVYDDVEVAFDTAVVKDEPTK